MASKRLIVTLTDDGQKKFAATTKQVRDSGLKVHEKMPELGMIVGEVTAATAAKTKRTISALPGVAAVEEEGTMEAL